jgi:4'-phosphopantetheinyl transferase superfamily
MLPNVVLLDAQRQGLADAGALRDRARATAPPCARHISRSYSFPYALVAWHDGPVGIDIERVAPCDAAFADAIRTPAERAAGDRGGEAGDRAVTSLWCSKEALAKALGDARRYDPRRLEAPPFWPGGRAGPWCAQALAAPAGHVAWLCWRHPVAAHASLTPSQQGSRQLQPDRP